MLCDGMQLGQQLLLQLGAGCVVSESRAAWCRWPYALGARSGAGIAGVPVPVHCLSRSCGPFVLSDST